MTSTSSMFSERDLFIMRQRNKEEKKELKKLSVIYDLELHDSRAISVGEGGSFMVIRVPGGWIYEDAIHHDKIFIPYYEE